MPRIVLWMSLLCGCSLPTVAVGGGGGLFRRGDANGDGAVNLTDPIATLEFLFLAGATPPCLDAADANDDGSLNITDPIFTLGFLFLGGPTLPLPGAGGSGPDPTDDALDCASYGQGFALLQLAALPVASPLFTADVPFRLFPFQTTAEAPVTVTSVRFELKLTRWVEHELDLNVLHDFQLRDAQGLVVGGPVNPTLVSAEPDGSSVTGQVLFTDPFTVPIGPWSFTLEGVASPGLTIRDWLSASLNPSVDVQVADPTLVEPTVPISSPAFAYAPTLLYVGVDPAFNPQRYLAGSTAAELCRLTLDASPTVEPVVVTALHLTIHRQGEASVFSNWQLAVVGRELVAANVPTLVELEPGIYRLRFELAEPLVVQPSALAKVSLSADIGASAVGWLMVTIPEDVLRAHGQLSGNVALTGFAERTGPGIRLIPSGTVVLKTVPDRPLYALAVGNRRDVVVGTLELETFGEDASVEQLRLWGRRTNLTTDGSAWGQIEAIRLSHGEQVVAETPVVPTAADNEEFEPLPAMFDFSPPLALRQGEPLVLTVRVDTGDVNEFTGGNSGRSGQGCELVTRDASDVTARGQQSAARLWADVAEVRFPHVTVFATVPTVTFNDQLPGEFGVRDGKLAVGVDRLLYRLQVTADLAADLGLRQVSFVLTTNAMAEVSDLKLIHFGVVLATGEEVDRRDGAGVAIRLYRFSITDPAGEVPTALNISAGTARTFELVGTVGRSDRNARLTVQLVGDSYYAEVFPQAAGPLADRFCLSPCTGSGHFVWTDYAESGPLRNGDPELLSKPQWTNGYSLPTADGPWWGWLSLPVTFVYE